MHDVKAVSFVLISRKLHVLPCPFQGDGQGDDYPYTAGQTAFTADDGLGHQTLDDELGTLHQRALTNIG